MQQEYINYMGHHWILIEDNTVLIGVNEEALNQIDKIKKVKLISEGEEVEQDDICGEIDTNDGTFKILAPVSGVIVEINEDVIEEPSLIFDDPYDSWLLKIEANNTSDLESLQQSEEEMEASSDDFEEDEDSDEEEENDEESDFDEDLDEGDEDSKTRH